MHSSKQRLKKEFFQTEKIKRKLNGFWQQKISLKFWHKASITAPNNNLYYKDQSKSFGNEHQVWASETSMDLTQVHSTFGWFLCFLKDPYNVTISCSTHLKDPLMISYNVTQVWQRYVNAKWRVYVSSAAIRSDRS